MGFGSIEEEMKAIQKELDSRGFKSREYNQPQEMQQTIPQEAIQEPVVQSRQLNPTMPDISSQMRSALFPKLFSSPSAEQFPQETSQQIQQSPIENLGFGRNLGAGLLDALKYQAI